MRINVSLPFDQTDAPEEFQRPEAISQIATLLERLGFDGCNVTDHPCPSGRWLDNGGHHAHDPFVLLALVAAATRTLRLQTGILVLPYRNPFVTARAVATLDHFSGGRLTLGVGAGYMKSEYHALGVDFDRRNDLVDEYIGALKAAWGADEFSFKGTGYEARGNRILPGPIQKPHPPLLVGGNSQRAIRRAVQMGDGWYPFFTAPGVAATSRTASITGLNDLTAAIRYMREYCETVGRVQPPEVVLGSVGSVGTQFDARAMLDKLGQVRDLGIRAAAVHIQASTRSEWCDHAERFAADVLTRLPEG